MVDVHERRSNEPRTGAEPRGVTPLVSYRASVEAVLRWKRSDRVVPGLHEIHEVAGRRQPAKQVLNFQCELRVEQNRRLLAVRAC